MRHIRVIESNRVFPFFPPPSPTCFVRIVKTMTLRSIVVAALTRLINVSWLLFIWPGEVFNRGAWGFRRYVFETVLTRYGFRPTKVKQQKEIYITLSALCIFLFSSVLKSKLSGKKTFFSLQSIKSDLISKTIDERPNSLAVLTIESNFAKKIRLRWHRWCIFRRRSTA